VLEDVITAVEAEFSALGKPNESYVVYAQLLKTLCFSDIVVRWGGSLIFPSHRLGSRCAVPL
jgi:hypothetical protein